MSIEALKQALPDYARDLKLNLPSVLSTPGLTDQQIWGSAVASALATGNAETIRAVVAEATPKLSADALRAAKTAAALMAMNNIYYRFVHLVANKEYATMPARLRMNAIANPGVDHVDFELYSLAVSAINGCGMCIDSHEKAVAQKGAGKDVVQAVIRIAAVIHAVAATLEGEQSLAA